MNNIHIYQIKLIIIFFIFFIIYSSISFKFLPYGDIKCFNLSNDISYANLIGFFSFKFNVFISIDLFSLLNFNNK